MPIFHQQTKHSYVSVRKNTTFLDWKTQPKNYKIYPHFNQRFKIDDYKELDGLNLIGGITYEKNYPDGTYYLRSVPSAGGLYPCEIYMQIRGVKGLLNGIYHYEPHSANIVLLQEIQKDGVEYYFNDKYKQKGFVFLVSSIYFRSSWKYKDRSIRYIFLDSGHQIGSIYAGLCVMGKESELLFDFDKLCLNDKFGFRKDELFTCAIRSSSKEVQEVSEIKQKLSYVSGCDYLQRNEFIQLAYEQSVEYDDEMQKMPQFFKNVGSETLQTAILNRRSIRAFYQRNITKENFDFILEDIYPFANLYNVDIFCTIHLVDKMQMGLYKNGTLVKEGDFRGKSEYLSLEQKLGGQSGVTFYFTSDEYIKYQKVNILAGFIAQIIYIRCEILNIGCTGIGAYYDDEVKEFLQTHNNILYLLAIGI